MFAQACSYYTPEPKVPKVPSRGTWPLLPFCDPGLTKDNAVRNNLRAPFPHTGCLGQRAREEYSSAAYLINQKPNQ